MATITVTEARKDMSRLMDSVIHTAPAVTLTRNRRDAAVVVEKNRFRHLLRPYRFTLEYEEVDGRFYGHLKEIPDIIVDGDTIVELKTNAAEYLQDYAEGYAEDFQLFYNAPNRRDHYPYVLAVLACDSIDEVKALID